MKNRLFLLPLLAAFSIQLWAGEMPEGYYNDANGKSDAVLKATLREIIRDHTAIPYQSGTWEVFYYSDRDEETGLCMDMYCDDWKPFSSPGSTPSGCNIEHSFAKSWWGGAKNDAYEDCYHLNPSNNTVNSARSNYPLGNVETPTKTAGSLKIGKRYSEEFQEDHFVFEPKDEYKGDFARAYFYMATCYGHDLNGDVPDLGKTSKKSELGWRKDSKDVGSYYAMRALDDANAYLEFMDWEIEVLLQWHRQDPVSVKEIKRANAVNDFQGNRNPFIDYPYLAEYIWGDKAGETVAFADLVGSFEADFIPGESDGSRTNSTNPAITSPKGTVAFGAAEVGKTATRTIAVKGRNLTGAVTLAITGANSSLFTLSTATVSADDALAGNNVTVTYAPTAEGAHTATLTLTSSGAADVAVTLTGNGAVAYKVTYDAGTGTPEVAASNETAVGTGVVLATATPSASCTDWTFAGWATAPVVETQTAPELLLAGDTYHPTANCTLYAVYKMANANAENNSENTKVTSLTTGDEIVIYYPAGGLALTATASGTKLAGVATTVENGSITSLGDGAVTLTVEVSGENIRFRNGDNYLICPSTGNGLSFGTATDYADWIFEESNGIQYLKNVNAKYKNTTDQYLEYYSGFTTYGLGTGGDAYVFEFYKFGSTTYATSPSCQLCTLTGIALNTDNAKKEFYAGDAFESGNLTVTASYSDCDQRTVAPTSVSTPDMDKVGTQTVTVSYTENGATKTATYDITIAAKPTYTVTFDAGTGNCATPETQVVQGESLALPEATLSDECQAASWTFAGWATAKVAETTDQPTLLKASEAYTPEANCTLYAVYKMADENSEAGSGSGGYEMITDVSGLTAGSTYLIVSTTPGKAASTLSGKYLTVADITISNNSIADKGEASEFVLGGNEGAWTLSCNEQLLGSSGNKTITYDSGTTTWSISIASNGDATITNSTTSYGRILHNNNSGSARFLNYASSTATSSSMLLPQLYKKSAGSTTVTTYNSTPDCKQDVTYTITFVDEGGTELQKINVKENALPQYTGTEPAKQATEQYTYTFAGWTPELVAATANATYTATYTATVRKYAVTFVNADGSTLQQSEWEYGQTPTYAGTPDKAATAEYTYTFDKWEPAIAAVTGEATYKATYTQTPVSYLLTWDLDGGTASGSYTPAGQTAFGTPLTAPTVTKEGYNFAGWNPTVAATMPAANTTYTATWATIAPAKYAIITSNSTGGSCHADKTEAEAGETITLTATPETGYEPAGWAVLDGNANEVTVTNNQFTMPASGVEVEAIFAEIEYSVSSVLTNTTAAADNPTTATISTEEIILTYAAAEGYKLPASISVTMGSTVLKDDDHYIWNAANGNLEIIAFDGITGNITVTIAATPKTYGVLLDKNGHGAEDGLVYIVFQGGIDADNCLWVTPNEGYTLNGYYTAATGGTKVIEANGGLVANVAGYTNGNGHWTRADEDLTLYAQWTLQTFTVTFVDYDGTVLANQTVAYGQAATAPENPTRTGYTFTGWNKAFDHVTSALTVTATYEKNTETAIGNATAAEPACHMDNGTLHVTGLTAGSRIALYDSTGRLLATRSDCAETETFALANGIYIVQVTANSKTTQTKIVK